MRRILVVAFGVLFLLSRLSLSAESKYYYMSFGGFRITYPDTLVVSVGTSPYNLTFKYAGGIYRNEASETQSSFILSYSNGGTECRMKVYTNEDASQIIEMFRMLGDAVGTEGGDILEFFIHTCMGQPDMSLLFSKVEYGKSGKYSTSAYQDYTAYYHGLYRVEPNIPLEFVYCRKYVKRIRDSYVCFEMVSPTQAGIESLQRVADTIVATY